MRKPFTVFIFIVFILSFNLDILATSYETLEPDEVVKRAEIIVVGSYNFESKPEKSQFIFLEYEFNVEQVLKGEATKKVMAGIDMNDVAWAKEFQMKGGKFLLLLEQTELASFHTPVVAQNGMVKLMDGKVDENDEKRVFYEDFLAEKSSITNMGRNMNLIPSITIGLFVLFIAVVSFLGIKRKRA